MADADLYIGRSLVDDEPAFLDMDHLTTHAACVGMTGSGKTGLGTVVLEELARRGIPLLVIDLKGDMIDLMLTFPDLDARSFEPWLAPDAAAQGTRTDIARQQAELWRGGLAGAGLSGNDIRAVREGVAWQVITPGAASGAPLDILPALAAPAGWDPDRDPDAATDRVNGVTSALLSLVSRGGDPLADRDHVLTASVILEHWRRGDTIDLPGLLASLANPPMESLGALPVSTFYPRDDRMKLVMDLNTLLASPAFAAWTRGVPLDMEALLGSPDTPRASIVTVAHLRDDQRSFVIALLVSELVAWMRRQPASSGLRAMLYMDEVFGILPPHPKNPPTKVPLLTLFKQGRAFGVGAWLATQNPVDLDYKALGNAGIKVIGRLVTDRDRERALEGLGLSRLADGRDPGEVVAALGKRQFVVEDVRAKDRVRTFSSRWAMSYLRGPVTLAELAPLIVPRPAAAEGEVEAASAYPAERGRPQPPPLESAVATCFEAGSTGMAHPGLLVRARAAAERATYDIRLRVEEKWFVPTHDDGRIDWESAVALAEPLATQEEPETGQTFPAAAPAHLDHELAKVEAAFVAWRARRPFVVLVNPKLTLAAGLDEGAEDFLERCLETADRADDRTQERMRRQYEGRMRTLEKRLARERDELDRDRTQLSSRRAEETLGVVEGLFSVLLGSRNVSSASRKAASKIRSAASKRRMRQTAASAVDESVREIERLEDELEDLAEELQDEIDRIAAESEEKAGQIEELAVRPTKAAVEVLELRLVWRSTD